MVKSAYFNKKWCLLRFFKEYLTWVWKNLKRIDTNFLIKLWSENLKISFILESHLAAHKDFFCAFPFHRQIDRSDLLLAKAYPSQHKTSHQYFSYKKYIEKIFSAVRGKKFDLHRGEKRNPLFKEGAKTQL